MYLYIDEHITRGYMKSSMFSIVFMYPLVNLVP